MSRRALKDEMPGIMLRGAIRSTAKAVAQYQLQHTAQRKDNELVALAALALTIVLASVAVRLRPERS